MKKFLCLFSCLFLALTLFASCKTQSSLSLNVSELRTNCYESIDSITKIKATYGYIESQRDLDGVAGQKIYLLQFRLVDKELDNTTYDLQLNHNQTEYNATFKLNPVSHTLTAIIEIENFNLSQFDVTLKYGSETQKITLKSVLPPNTITYLQALSSLQRTQSQLLQSYCDANGKFNAEICLRVLVKNNHPYWFISISDKQSTKALLIDGFSGEVLAVRDVF